jgi:predicted TIM-barrel fold metal-dependent hydrolase
MAESVLYDFRLYPPEIIHYMNTRGADKIMFATASLIAQKRAMEEIKALPFKNDEVRHKFLRGNALKLYDWGVKKKYAYPSP